MVDLTQVRKKASDFKKDAERRMDQATQDTFAWSQAKIDVITAKAATNESSGKITADEKAFLYAVYHAIGWGGSWKGMPEASLLIRTYVRAIPVLWGEPDKVDIGSQIYETSPGVKKEMERQMKQAKAKLAGQKVGATFSQKSGKMIAEQNNRRMKYADNRFILKSTTVVTADGFETTFRVDNTYDFEPFKGGKNWKNVSKWSVFPYKGNQLVIYDGLSQYLTKIGMAAEFDYYAEWTRVHK